MNAQIAIVQVPAKLSSKTMTVAAATAAPAETPTTPGSASGLPNTPCISAPAVAQAGAGESGHHDAREAHLPEGVLPLRVVRHRPDVQPDLVHQRAEHLGRWHVELAVAGGDHQRDEQHHAQPAEQADPAGSRADDGPLPVDDGGAHGCS